MESITTNINTKDSYFSYIDIIKDSEANNQDVRYDFEENQMQILDI